MPVDNCFLRYPERKPWKTTVDLCMAGLCAEEVLLGTHGRQGWGGDRRIVRIGDGWVDPMTPEQWERLLQYIDEAHRAVVCHEAAVRSVADSLLLVGKLTGADVTVLACGSEESGHGDS